MKKTPITGPRLQEMFLKTAKSKKNRKLLKKKVYKQMGGTGLTKKT